MSTPTVVRAAAPIPLPLDVCWQKLRDLTRARDYVPGLRDSVIRTERKEGVGASRVVSHAQFGDMDETVIAWDEGVGLTVRLHQGDRPARPFAEAAFRYELRPARDAGAADASGRCEIHTSLTYRLPWGLLGRLLDRLLFRRLFRRNVEDVAVCLAENYRTDAKVPPSAIRGLRANRLPA
ncbi:MAG: SRPBCC family protein [Spirochaetaceae bacterium]|nr:SRPBCC family protein [Myxococcales bacterium]MCB9724649.1 SRPBCC family protein [Spirochaetaceae bacterium]HPG28266.1 SRPBCC family protein [Myxococcota bacterium]